MAKFITLTIVHHGDGTTEPLDVNFDLVSYFGVDFKHDTTRVEIGCNHGGESFNCKETPHEIRAMLNKSTSEVHIKHVMQKGVPISDSVRKPGVIVPMRYTFEGVEVTEQEIIDALRAYRRVQYKGLLGQEYVDWVRDTFRTHSDPRPGSYDVGVNQAIEIAEIIRHETLRVQARK